MSLNQVNSSGELERVAGLVNSEKINEMYEAFPSNASTSNKLVTQDSVSNVIQGIIPMSDSSSVTGDITFGVDADGNYGYYKVGADTVTPFKSGGSGVSEFGDSISKSLYYDYDTAGDSSPTLRYRPIVADTDISLSQMSLTKGIWLAILPLGRHSNVNMKIKDTNGNYISALSRVIAEIYSSTVFPNLYIFNLDEDKTINAFQLTTNTVIQTFSGNNSVFYAYFIKLL